jgi:hypothetical protein
MDRRFDPRTIVTPYAFAVHPDLLGMPLATPWQRLGAILVDLIVIGFISQVGLGPLAIASTLLLFWLSTRKQGRDVVGKVFRISVGCLGILILTGTILVIVFIRISDDLVDEIEERSADSALETTGDAGTPGEDSSTEDLGFLDLIQGLRGAADLARAESKDEAQELMNGLARRAYAAGISRRQIREILSDATPSDAPWSGETREMLEEAINRLASDPEATPGEIQSGEEPPESGSPVVLSQEAEDSIASLQEALDRAVEDEEDLTRDLARARAALEEESDQGLFAWLWGLIDELGIGFGWGALYLTITHAWWRGTSIGKRLFRIRVVMIDKRPLNWWLSFERAGGYAAGFATGLLGFVQIFWDPNRQAIHDKVSETIVIQDGKDPIPGPWVEEGRAQWKKGRPPPPATASTGAPTQA